MLPADDVDEIVAGATLGPRALGGLDRVDS
jgi:hypothetical protein